MRKAGMFGGGFVDSPPKAKTTSRQKGLLAKRNIEPYGTAATPWNMQLDYQWIRAHVRYVFVNWKDAKEETLPPGLVVEATNDGGASLATGTCIDDSDGTAYVLIPATQDKWKTIHLGFRTPKGAQVDLSNPAASPDRRLGVVGTFAADRSTRNTLPNAWHSYGMGAAYAATATGTPGATRKTWTDLRKDIANDGSATEPLVVFQLDDVVLYDKNKLATVPHGTRFTAFDHLLAVRNPDTGNSLPHYTTGTLETPLIDQKTVFAMASGGASPTAPTVWRDLGTRLIVVTRSFYDFDEKRVIGTPGKTLCLGSRAAVLNDHPVSDNGTYGSPYLQSTSFGGPQVHYIPVPSTKDPKSSTQLGHMLLFVSCNVKLNGVAVALADLHTELTNASERWSQGSPGVKTSANPVGKDYRIVPKDATQRNNIILRVRAFFGPVTDGSGTYDISMATGGNRSNCAPHQPASRSAFRTGT